MTSYLRRGDEEREYSFPDSVSDAARQQRLDRLALLGTFALGIAHELATPIGTITMAARYALETDDPARRTELLEAIVRDSGKCRHILAALSAFFCDGRLEKSTTSVAGLARRATARICEEGGVLSLKLRGEIESVSILCHAPALEQALCELLRNSVCAGQGQATVTLSVVRSCNRVEIQYEDDGPGIAAADLELVFESLYSSAASGASKGLGLAIARHIVLAHGGTLLTKPREGLRGARFIIDLPADA